MQNENLSNSCGICYEPFSSTRLFTVGACNHSGICSLCALRNRHLLNDYTCSFCKQDMEYVVCTTRSDAQFHHFERWGDDLGAEFEFDCKSRMFFPKQYYKNEVCPLKQHVCPEPACKVVFRDSKTLKKHLTTKHDKVFCDICVENKLIFPAEQLTYTRDEYSRHIKTGDYDGSRGHPSCRFCKKRFYDIDSLFQHLEREHFSCHVCSQDNTSSQNLTYYKDYSSLHTHFRTDHHICQEAVCLENKFTVFSNQISLILHHKQHHPSSELSANPTVSINNSCTLSHHTHVKKHATTCCSQYEGGCGGVVVDGEWEVKLETTHFLPHMIEKDTAALLLSSHSSSEVSMDFSEQEYPPMSSASNDPHHIMDSLLAQDKRFKHDNSKYKTKTQQQRNAGKSSYQSDFPTLETTNFPTLETTNTKTQLPMKKTPINLSTCKSQRSQRNTSRLDPSWGGALCGLTAGRISSSNGRKGYNNYRKLSVYKPAARRGLNDV